MLTLRTRALIVILLIGIVGLPLSHLLVHLLTEFWWFQSTGFTEVFWTRLTWKVLVGLVSFGVYAVFLGSNVYLAWRGSRSRTIKMRNFRALQLTQTELEHYTNQVTRYFVIGLIGLVAWVAAVASAATWETILKALNASMVGDRDPIFAQDIGFYLFQLPFYQGLHSWVLLLLVWGLGMALMIYLLKGMITLRLGWQRLVSGPPKTHLSLLLAAIAVLVACGFWLERYQILYSPTGVVFGAGYTDAHAQLFAYGVMALLSLIFAFLCLLTLRRSTITLPLWGLGLYLLALLLVKGTYPWAQQQFIVEPNELTKEAPYIEHNIQFTQKAYHLQDVQRQDYEVKAQLNPEVLQQNQSTLDNVRLWDYRPLLSTYRQLQEIRLYYQFQDVDVDRYVLKDGPEQVMLSARELSVSRLPDQAQTWVNQRLKYTHGHGLVMSPVNRATADGLPELYIKNIPPVSAIDLPIKRPELYYGEATDTYVFTGTSTQEFDYPQGKENVLTRYSGQGGVPMPSLWHRLAYAYDLNSLQILISNYFTDQSRIHYYRQIQTRVNQIAPFLQWDSDPYLVVIDGRLQWILDAYTVSDRYPYSEPVLRSPDASSLVNLQTQDLLRTNPNYIRNSVKVIVDAYDGSLQFWAVDDADPILRTYRQIFPKLFRDASAIPAKVKTHFRYPLDLFKIQAQMYRAYHMTNSEVFYNQEDLWQFPKQSFEGNQLIMDPYYVTMRLPGQASDEFILILPFTPTNKDNMIAWMVARSNGADYGKLLLYEFPKQKLIYGPRQIEARIDQEPNISQQFTLWGQAGSTVIRGDLLVIPIQESLLYVEPVYLKADQGELPELKRVIIAYENTVVMEETFDAALSAIFGQKSATLPIQTAQTASTQPRPNQATADLARQALDTYQQAQDALRQGNWSDYGRHQQQLKELLQQLNQER